ncbi:MAG: sigma-70 family RNA polymerase sigma factor [Comamonadaceae bacterium]|nr:MAG: sigma-70 family RNA polymerase sigma factor [Comamonadaceae bacterium]
MQLSAPFTRALLSGFDHAYPDLLRIATRTTGSREEARELVHDTWVRLAEHAHGGGTLGDGGDAEAGPRDVTAYLAVMAQHMAVDAQRRRQRRQQHADGAALQEQMAPSHTPDVADTVMYRQALAVLESTLAGLPERTRSAFVAHRVHGDKQPEIAAHLDVSLNTVERDLIQAGACIEDALVRWRGGPVASHGGLVGGYRPSRRRGLGALLGLAGVGVAGSLGWHQWLAWQGSQVQWQAQWHNPRGQQTRHALPDGSSVHLDADSQVQVAFYAGRRTVRLLRGAAFFEVARDAQRPFSVDAAHARVTVLGTRFSVDLLAPASPDASSTSSAPDPAVLVQVESGRVQVQPQSGPPRELGAGQGLRLQGDTVRLLTAAAQDTAPWRKGELVFAAEPLGEALARLSRYTPLVLEATSDAALLPVSGRVRIARAGTWLQALPHALPVRVQERAEGGWHVSRRG